MNVLIACEESQRVCTAFREKGHNAYSCDIQVCSGGHPEWHIQNDVLNVIDGDCLFETMDGVTHYIESSWDLIIAHPPCTYLSNAGVRWLYNQAGLNLDRYKQGILAKEFFMRMLNANCNKICVENPIPSKVWELPPYSQIIQPYMFGHPVTKKTALWLKGLPKLKETNNVGKPEKETYITRDGIERTKCWVVDSVRGSVERSKTFEGIAAAMAEQWG